MELISVTFLVSKLDKLKIIFKKLLKNTSFMFCGCSSLTNIDLSNFNTNNVTDMKWMFFGCYSLKKENIITKNKRIWEICLMDVLL